MLITIGYSLIMLGLFFFQLGITQELSKKMSNQTGKLITTQKIKFNKQFVNEKGEPIEEIEFLVTKEKENKNDGNVQ